MSYLNKFLLLLVLFVNSVYEVQSGCTLSLNQDFGSPDPIFVEIQNGDGALLAPNEKGAINVESSKTLLVACVGERRFVVLGNETQDFSTAGAECLGNGTFRVGQWKGHFKDIKCNAPPWVTVEKTSQVCYGGNQIIRVGYKINNEFFTHYEACFNKNLLSTLYVRHFVDPTSYFTQKGSRPKFIEGGLFGKACISNLYKLANQKKRINSALGDDMDKLYLSKKQFLTRGHLAPRADFPLRGGQRASFQYVNTAPQWHRGNAGDWAALEESIRRRIKAYGDQVTVYTGTYGVMTLPDHGGVQKELYLHLDENNNEAVPVPMYYYKILHDVEKKSAVAFISINSSFYNTTMLDDLTFCNDICNNNPKFSWLKWRANDGTFSFCCDFKDFNRTVDHLKDLEVKKMFF